MHNFAGPSTWDTLAAVELRRVKSVTRVATLSNLYDEAIAVQCVGRLRGC
jgi:hypothetical protein